MSIEVDEVSKLDKMLEDHGRWDSEGRLLVLKLLAEIKDVGKVSRMLKIPESTLYSWLKIWNKKKRYSHQAGVWRW